MCESCKCVDIERRDGIAYLKTHTEAHSASILLDLYSHHYESAGEIRISFAVALIIDTHTERG